MRPLRFFFLLLLLAASAFALDVPPRPEYHFTDRASVVNDADAQAIDRKLAAFEQQSGAQFIVYVMPSLEGESVEDFTQRCVDEWKVGQKKYDNGLVMFVFINDRKIRIATGYGVEGSMTDAFSSRVIRDVMAPYFQKGDYTGGINAGVDAITAKITKNEEPVAPLQPRTQPSSQGGGQQSDLSPMTILIILFVIFFVVVPMFSRRRRGGGCGGCFFPWFFFPGGGGGITFGGGGGGFGGGGGSSWGGGGFSGGGGSFGGGGATGGW
ncbi:MAG TPA: TPM domain-containing protein [Thermoanaerobaculia bacterium]|nr:TPM domain-containing protein [Thermoanaerobaculia bacterium]